MCALVGACMDQKRSQKKGDVMTHLCKNVNLTQDVVDLLDNLQHNMQKLTKVNVLEIEEVDPECDHMEWDEHSSTHTHGRNFLFFTVQNQG